MIHLSHLPNDISFDIDSDEKNTAYPGGMYVSKNKDNEYYDMNSDNCRQLSCITDKITDLFSKYKNGELALEDISNTSLEYLNEFTNKAIFRDDEYKRYPVYADTISKVLESCINTLKNNYGIKFNDNMKQILAYLINCFQENNLPCSSDSKTNVETALKIIQSVYPKEYIIASKIQSYISTSMDANFDSTLTIYLALYIRDLTSKDDINEIAALVAARGYSTANSIAGTVNKLLKHFIFDYIDLPPECSSQYAAEKVLEYIESFGTLKKIIVLVDIDSLEVICNLLGTRCKIEVGIISSITTQLALDVGSMIITGQPIMQIISEASSNNSVVYNIVKPVRAKKNAVITTCSTGIGTAIKIKDLLKKCLGDNIEVLAYDFNQLKLHGINDDIFHEYNIKLIIGTLDPEIETIPYLSLENLIAGKGKSVFNNLLKDFAEDKVFEQINKELVNIFSLQNVLNYLTILNPDKIFSQVDKAISGLELSMRIKFTNDLRISLYIHICCMIERLIIKDPLLSYNGLSNFEQSHSQFIKLFKSSFSVIEDIYRTEIPVSEIAFIYDIIEEKLKGFSTISSHI
jgi:sigma-54 dependent transcriptional regulator of gfr operon